MLALEAAQVLLPLRIAVEVESVKEDVVTVPEGGIDTLAVGGRCGGGKAALEVDRGLFAGEGLLPQNLALVGADADHVSLRTVSRRPFQKDTVAPDDRRRVTAAGQRRLPEDVLALAELGRHVLVGRDAGAVGPAEASPGDDLVLVIDGPQRGGAGAKQEEGCKCDGRFLHGERSSVCAGSTGAGRCDYRTSQGGVKQARPLMAPVFR